MASLSSPRSSRYARAALPSCVPLSCWAKNVCASRCISTAKSAADFFASSGELAFGRGIAIRISPQRCVSLRKGHLIHLHHKFEDVSAHSAAETVIKSASPDAPRRKATFGVERAQPVNSARSSSAARIRRSPGQYRPAASRAPRMIPLPPSMLAAPPR